MKRVLVTGANGFVGRHALASLRLRGFEIVATSSRPVESGTEGVQWIQVDLMDTHRAMEIIAQTLPTHLLHLAWYSEPGLFWNSPENFSWVQGSIALLESFVRHGGRRVVGVGTCAEYDWSFGLCVENSTPLNPRTPYGVCKHALQAWQTALCRENGVSSAWARPFLMYGPGERRERLVASVITSLLSGHRARCADGTQIRDFLHVHDVADALAALLDSSVAGPVNIASGSPVALRSAVARIGELLGRTGAIDFGAITAPPHDPPRLLASTCRLRNEVKWQPEFDLDKGLEQTIQWWKERFRN